MKSSIFWDITPYSPVKVNIRFGGTGRLHLQGRRISQTRNWRESRWQAERTTRRRIPKDRTLVWCPLKFPLKCWRNIFIWTTYVRVYVIDIKIKKKSVIINQWGFSKFVKYRPLKIIYKFMLPPSLTLSEKYSFPHCCMFLSCCMVTAETQIALQPLSVYTHNKLQNVPVQLQQSSWNVSPAAYAFSESASIKPYWFSKAVRGYNYTLNSSWELGETLR
jgi:hypothetical protein